MTAKSCMGSVGAKGPAAPFVHASVELLIVVSMASTVVMVQPVDAHPDVASAACSCSSANFLRSSVASS